MSNRDTWLVVINLGWCIVAVLITTIVLHLS